MKQLSLKRSFITYSSQEEGAMRVPHEETPSRTGGREEGERVGKGLYCDCYTIQWVRRPGKQA